MKKENRPQIVTYIYFDTGTVEVSSIDYTLEGVYVNETCVFYTNMSSEVIGTYDDHFKIVTNLMEGHKK
jgi:hypothetical protein